MFGLRYFNLTCVVVEHYIVLKDHHLYRYSTYLQYLPSLKGLRSNLVLDLYFNLTCVVVEHYIVLKDNHLSIDIPLI